ncbi:metalloprotease TldD [Psychrobium sp. 1_MG-2023]|uniref:metalloprotease TldD n=1 Tax=Psychrobium sp. 1_MG-2023 TaxID=3062624 RepID=UPI000C32711F|nr:metalloprotease TldD [Psychrobium sp. 1_MG-2023]MDP2560714.1 metalloprotease TldD [Psychrobium sp. 1_MG-2023]PKF56608.1 metalloprotease TldD [Alteromonadales bacterium alter-6D02]
MSFEKVSESLLAPTGLSTDHLHQYLTTIHQHKIDFADLYFQASHHESWVLEDGIIKEGSFNIERGVGVRAISGEKTGFAYADEINDKSISQSVLAARGIAQAGYDGKVNAWQRTENIATYQEINPLSLMSEVEKLDILRSIDQHARAQDPKVSQVVASISGVYEEILVAATDGTLATDIRPLVRLNCSVIVEDNGKRERGSAGGGGRSDYSFFLQSVNGKKRLETYAEEAVRQALVNLSAIDAPAGMMPVVLGNGWPAVLLHEAVGHGLEGDFNRKGSSAFSGKIGQQVASPLCTVIDDGTMSDRRGSLSIDDEGVPGQRNVLIEEGILKGYMFDKHNARLMDTVSTGNGRRESYASLPLPRMTNTFMLAGQSDPKDIIASVEDGIYAPNFGGGQVDITSGKFVFSASEAYIIKNGEIGAAIKGATLIGSGSEAMQQISMLGNDLELDPGVGVCGKDGQSVPVGVGQPTLKLDKITVGGTE